MGADRGRAAPPGHGRQFSSDGIRPCWRAGLATARPRRPTSGRFRPTRVSLALDAVVCGSGTTGLRTVVPAVTFHGSFRCRATGLCCARSVPKVLRTFRISGPGTPECESEAACLDCGGTVGRGGPRTRTGRTAMWPHLGHNLDTVRRGIRAASAVGKSRVPCRAPRNLSRPNSAAPSCSSTCECVRPPCRASASSRT